MRSEILFLRHSLVPILALLVVFANVAGLACSSSFNNSSNSVYIRERNPELTLTIEDVRDIGFKTIRQYDIQDLTGATEAWFGFRQVSGLDPVEYEIRIYVSHDDAIEHGAFFAQDVIGPDGNIFAKDAAWKMGTADRWSYRGGEFNSTRVAKYHDYIIIGNLIVLCEGLDADASAGVCLWMATKLVTSGNN